MDLVAYYGADPTGIQDSSLAFQDAANEEKYISVPYGTYNLETVVYPQTNQMWFNCGATLVQHSSTEGLLAVSNQHNVAFLGVWNLLCDFGGGETSQVLFKVTNSRHIVAENFNISGAVNIGMEITPGTDSTLLGVKGQYSNFTFRDCYKGLSIPAGTDAEYNDFVQINASGCVYPVLVAAGNTRITNGNIVQNTNGIRLLGGDNNGHGFLSNVSSNHNTNNNLYSDSVTNGFSINNCHFYGDNDSGLGKISFTNSKNIVLSSCFVDCVVENNGTAGYNYLQNCLFPGTFYRLTGTNPNMVYVQ